MRSLQLLLFFFTYFLFSSGISIGADTLVRNQSISGNQTLVSSGQTFELGFINLGTSKNRYLAIWYTNVTTTFVWIANRNNPITDSPGVLSIENDGNIAIGNGLNDVIWSSNSSRSVEKPTLQLLETGNLVLRDGMFEDTEDYLWQSFDHPSHTLLPGMKQGWDRKTGLNRYLTSWKNLDDPSPGVYTYGFDLAELPQLVLKNGSIKLFRTGAWNGVRFSGLPNFRSNLILKGTFVSNTDEVYYMNDGTKNSVLTMFSVDPWGMLRHSRFDNQTRKWTVMLEIPRDKCDDYNDCGTNGVCNINNSPTCECLQGFTPKSQEQWGMLNWAGGCVRRAALECGNGDIFVELKGVKLPDMINFRVNKSMNLNECEMECTRNCSCTAYANSNIMGRGSGCIMWFGDLLDIREFTVDDEQNLYIRLAASEQDPINNTSKKRSPVLRTVLLSVGSALILFCLIICSIIWRNRRNRKGSNEEKQDKDLELPLIDLTDIEAATDNFSQTNKIGEGGFGPVYKGKLKEGQIVAIKRLSKNSGQGLNEFKNEVILIAKLQHRNLVKLLGCCIEGEERMLVYEYMPNESLDYFIFDQKRSKLLTWEKRLGIVTGIARGLLYLHQDSRLIIIHRDFKTSNILLDINMTPKISDFGMARMFGGDQTEAKTKRVVGTYGYMSPEYAIDGHFSMKSDVFSFGVVVLEIVSGKKNRGFYHDDHHHNLLGHAWLLWKEGNALKIMDPSLEDSRAASSEVLRCIQVGLLCVQQFPEDRPSMSSVVFMLGSEDALLPEPKQPGFFIERSSNETSSTEGSISENHVTISVLEAR